MDETVYTELKKLKDWEPVYDALQALEKLTGVEAEALPMGCVTVDHEISPNALQVGERVLFHFEGVEEDMTFRRGDKVIEIFSRGRDEPVCRFKLGRVFHEWGEAFYPLRAEVRGVNVSILYDVESDHRLFRYLQDVDRRAAWIFSIMWRLRMGPVVLGRNDEIVGAIYS